MASENDNIDEVAQVIFNLYYDCVNIEEAVKLMGSQNISAELVKSIYNELSTEIDKLTDRFYYYTIEVETDDVITYWTSRYFLAYRKYSPDSAFHEIKIIDLFNNKSM
jgi:hypothetical protein